MNKTYLKTTKLDISEEKNIKEIHYLGDWCLELKEKLNSDSNYYLYCEDNKENFFKQLLKLKEKILIPLISFLNDFHNVNKDYKYWNFLIGPWLLQFLHVLHDRWEIYNFKKDCFNQNLYTYILDLSLEKLTPNEMMAAKHIYYSDLWSHFIFGEIIKFKKQIKYESISEIYDDVNTTLFKKINSEKGIRGKILKIFFNISKLFYSEKKINNIIFPVDLHYLFQFKIYLKFSQFPIIVLPPPKNINHDINSEIRKKFLKFEVENDFETFVSENLIKHLPKSLIENYFEIIELNLDHYKKFKSKNYFISQFEMSDQIKFFLAEENTSKKIIYQHGGGYGSLEFHPREITEIQASDYFLTFGWNLKNAQNYLSQNDKNKIIEFYPVHLTNKSIDTKNNKMIYLILDEFPNYLMDYSSNIDGHNYKIYFQNIINFINKLDQEVKKNLVVRIYPEKRYKDAPLILKEIFPEIKIDYADTPLIDMIKKTKICILGNNGTIFLQTIRINVPTIIFFNKNVRLRKNAKKYYKDLHNEEIFYQNEELAAKFCNTNINNIYEWWNNQNKQIIISKFLEYFADKNTNKIKNLYKLIDNEKKN